MAQCRHVKVRQLLALSIYCIDRAINYYVYIFAFIIKCFCYLSSTETVTCVTKRNALTNVHSRTPEEETREKELAADIVESAMMLLKDDLRLETR